MHCRIISALIGGIALTLAVALNANAFPITFSFSVTATSGPLDGITENGTFTYDSSSIIPGGINDNTGLLTGLNFTWNGITYNQTTANTSFLLFNSSGDLTKALFGPNCMPSMCSIDADTNEWALFATPGETTTPPFGFIYATPSTGGSEGTVTTALSPIPEPSALALVGVGVAGLMLVGARLQRRLARLSLDHAGPLSLGSSGLIGMQSLPTIGARTPERG
jgi:hypothetical protein